jgi:hypothetical protein
MAQRKYLSEFGLNMCTRAFVLLQQAELNKIDNIGFEPHIYIIGKRPRITIDLKSVLISKDRINGRFVKQVKNDLIPIEFDTQNLLGTADVDIHSEYPFTEYHFIDRNNICIAEGKCALQLAKLGTQYWEHLDLEVLYVGQSYGKEGERTAIDRIKNHSTLQGIYAEAIKNSPDQEIWIILCGFDTYLMSCIDGRSENYATTMEEDDKHISTVIRTNVTEQQKINFTEAAIIKYFKPEYNQIYKDSFPNPAHSTYSECYDIDLNMVSVELQTEVLALRLWSPYVSPSWIHFCKFPLHSIEDRKYMFDFSDLLKKAHDI